MSNQPSDSRRCPRCGAVNSGGALECVHCQASLVPPPSVPPSAPIVAPPPTYTAPAPSALPRRRSSACLVVGCVLISLVVLAAFGVGGWYAWSRFVPVQPAGKDQSTPSTPATQGDALGSADTGVSSDGLALDGYVGTWEFVGEPGPWGEGAPFTLERSGNILVGTAGQPDWDDKTRLELAAGNEELQGESATTSADGQTEFMALRMQLDPDGNLLTVKYRGADGQWRTRVAKRAAAAGGAAGAVITP